MSNNVGEIRLLDKQKLWKNGKIHCISMDMSRECRKMSEGYLGAICLFGQDFW